MFNVDRNIKYRFKAFSIIEVLVVLAISSVLFLAIYPVITKRLTANNIDIEVLKCVVTESAGSLTSSACLKTIENSLFEKNSTSKSLIYLADNGRNSVEKVAARKILAASCDKGGEQACAYMVESCKKDVSNCDIVGSNDDLYYFLNLNINTNNLGKRNIVKYTSSLYEGNNNTIKNLVDTRCCRPSATYACLVKGMTECPMQEYFSSGTYSSGYSNGITTDLAGNIYSTGKIYNGSFYDAFVVKTDRNGNILWQKNISSNSSVDTEGKSIAVDFSGNVYVGGQVNINTNDIFLVKFDFNGNNLWQYTLNRNPSGVEDKGLDIVIDSNNHIIIVGHSKDTGSLDAGVIQYTKDGTFVWSSGYNSTNNKDDSAIGVAVDSSNNIYITGYSTQTAGNIDLLITKLTSDGQVSWSKRYNSSSDAEEKGNDIYIDSLGYIYITGYSGSKLIILKFDTAGNLLDYKTYSAAGAELKGYGIKADIDGNIYVSGIAHSTSYDTIVLKFSNEIKLKWVRKIQTSSSVLESNSINIDRQGQIYVSTYSYISSKDRPSILRMKKEQTSNFSLTENNDTYTNTTPNMNIVSTSFTQTASSFNINDTSLAITNPYLDFK